MFDREFWRMLGWFALAYVGFLIGWYYLGGRDDPTPRLIVAMVVFGAAIEMDTRWQAYAPSPPEP